MAGEVLLTNSKDEMERVQMLSEYKYEAGLQSKLVTVDSKGRSTGRKEGMLSKKRNCGMPCSLSI